MTRIYVVGGNAREVEDYIWVMRSPGIQFVSVTRPEFLRSLLPGAVVHLVGRYQQNLEWPCISETITIRGLNVVEVAEWR